MTTAEIIALVALLVSVAYNWLSRRDAATSNQLLRTSFEAALQEWKKTADRRIDVLESDFRNSQIGVLANRMNVVEQRIVELRDMKHLKVDPYLPRAFDDLNRRVERLESK